LLTRVWLLKQLIVKSNEMAMRIFIKTNVCVLVVF
jgi:hypothetical protein